MFRTAALTVLLSLLPAAAQAGTVTRDSAAITYTAAADAGAAERVLVGLENGIAYVDSDRGVDTTDCTEAEPTRADCEPAPGFIVFLLGFDDTVSAAASIGAMTLEVHGGGGADGIAGTPNKDRLHGDAGVDTIDGFDGDDLLEGGLENDSLDGHGGTDTIRGGGGDDSLAGGEGHDHLEGGDGQDTIDDGPGDDAILGGSANDYLRAGTGRDTIDGGDGVDRVDYSTRSAGVTISLDGGADDGESGEGDDLGTNVEAAAGGSGNDRLVGNASGNTLAGNGGNDSITAGTGEDRVEGGEGDDVIDTRDGRYDSVDCGPGMDTVFADPGDGTAACESAPDADGDGYLADVDCKPLDPKINPGAVEVPGNDVDEDCKDGPLYLRVTNPVAYATKKVRGGVRVTSFKVSELLATDRVELRCKGGKRRGCAFKIRRYTGRTGAISLVCAFKKRRLEAGAVIELRVLRVNWIGKVQRLRVERRRRLADTDLCLFVGETSPRACA